MKSRLDNKKMESKSILNVLCSAALALVLVVLLVCDFWQVCSLSVK